MEPQHFYGEFRKQLKAAQISIKLDPSTSSSEKDGLFQYSLEVQRDSIELSCKEEPLIRWRYQFPRGLTALPGTCSGLEWVRHQGPHLRLQLDDSAQDSPKDSPQEEERDIRTPEGKIDAKDGETTIRRGDGNHDEEEKKDSSRVTGDCNTVEQGDDDSDADYPGDDDDERWGHGETGEDPFLETLRHPDCEVICARCDAPILQSAGSCKRRVLALPSGDWGDLAGDMWCCKSKVIAADRGKMAAPDLTPHEGSILVGDLHIVVNSRSLTRGSVRIESRKKTGQAKLELQAKKVLVVSCCRCGNIIGAIDSQGASAKLDATKLYRYAVKTRNTQKKGCVVRTDPLQYTLSNHMMALFKNQMTFKFIVDDEEEHIPRLLIWLLSVDTRLLSDRAPPMAHDMPGSSHPKPVSTPGGQPSQAGEKTVVDMALHSHPIIKVLYLSCHSGEGKRLSKEWNKDLMVQGLTLTREACLQLGLLLATSTLRAPPTMRQMNGFMVGSMRL